MRAGYRSDIDGLRAIAVLAIVLFHISPTKLTGGFVGVDVFFVISGYLITQHIHHDLLAARFSVADFYAKRIRRLFPALIVTVLVTLAASTILLFPLESKRAAEASLATATYTSNIYFYLHADYFSEGEIRPLLHTWSLAVEEQFYLFFPFVLLILHRYARETLIPVVIAITVGSLAVAEWLVEVDSDAAFYFSFTRFWEFGVGALLALVAFPRLTQRNSEGATLLGLAAIGLSILLLSNVSSVPGVIAAIPVLGTALVIHAGQSPGAILNRLLGSLPMIFVGRISYSLYLVHWPIIVLTKARYGPDLPVWGQAALLAGSLCAAWLLYRFVECPTRAVSIRRHRQRIYAFGGLSSAAVAAVAGILIWTDGFDERHPLETNRLIAYLDYDAQSYFRAEKCLLNAEADKEDDVFDLSKCVPPATPDRRQVLLIGDSHAAQYYQALHDAFPAVQVAQVTATGCRPLLETEGAERCVQLMHMAFKELVTSSRYSAIILAARWQNDEIGKLVRTVNYLKPATDRVYVLGPVVEYDRPLPRLLALAQLHGAQDLLDASRELPRIRQLDRRMHLAMGQLGGNVRYLSVLQAMCSGKKCVTTTPLGVPVQFDYGHLTYDGAAHVIQQMLQKELLRLG